ncbi:putative inositol polyphosphate [Diplodia seriata]|uniref:Putative inositol polyphosphate n=1 Tax=Diplodia seriata TaxID=420778 RepID=A0A0G2EH87_9PEZI|nr:putative inositol polyphosphate [Diplodia seriata]
MTAMAFRPSTDVEKEGDMIWLGSEKGELFELDIPTGAVVADKRNAHSSKITKIYRIWDGMLKDDWLEQDMQEHDLEFCDFREVSATIMTWNAGAVKPTSLSGRFEEQDGSFFRDLLRPDDPSDILVFGFQELVDLEDKKVTAKSFFKSSKKKDASDQEHMSRQYPNMVGLFTCVFVKESERMRIRDMSAAEIKLGMGGLHGNKGALVVRFTLDDSSICFVNCHLAAGQSQTAHRNNDVATIMETSALPPQMDLGARADVFVGGGDGSMIMDHEICILNGDLNYRIDSMTRDTVIRHVREGNLTRLLENDQLLRTKKRNPGFRLRAFRECPITFAPTYKYDVGTDRLDYMVNVFGLSTKDAMKLLKL